MIAYNGSFQGHGWICEFIKNLNSKLIALERHEYANSCISHNPHFVGLYQWRRIYTIDKSRSAKGQENAKKRQSTLAHDRLYPSGAMNLFATTNWLTGPTAFDGVEVVVSNIFGGDNAFEIVNSENARIDRENISNGKESRVN